MSILNMIFITLAVLIFASQKKKKKCIWRVLIFANLTSRNISRVFNLSKTAKKNTKFAKKYTREN